MLDWSCTATMMLDWQICTLHVALAAVVVDFLIWTTGGDRHLWRVSQTLKLLYSSNNTGSCWKYRSWCICSSDIISIAEQLDFLDALLINRLAIVQMWGKFWYWDCHNSFWGEKAAWEASYCKHCVDRGDERNSCPFHQEGAYSQAMEWAETGCGAKGCRPWGAGAGGRHSGSLEGFRLFMHLTLGTLLNIYMSWDILPSVCTLILQSNYWWVSDLSTMQRA